MVSQFNFNFVSINKVLMDQSSPPTQIPKVKPTRKASQKINPISVTDVEVPQITTPQKKDIQTQFRQKLLSTQSSVRIIKTDNAVSASTQKKINFYTGCNCTKSQCLKMYCACFAEGKMCDNTCLCQACKNKTENQQRSEAIVEIITKDPLAFSRKSDKVDSVEISCNCSKSACQKKYCDCFRKGRLCGLMCNCRDCKNKEKIEQSNYGIIRKKVKIQ